MRITKQLKEYFDIASEEDKGKLQDFGPTEGKKGLNIDTSNTGKSKVISPEKKLEKPT